MHDRPSPFYTSVLDWIVFVFSLKCLLLTRKEAKKLTNFITHYDECYKKSIQKKGHEKIEMINHGSHELTLNKSDSTWTVETSAYNDDFSQDER